MSQVLSLKIKGLFTNANEFSETPEGALSIANDIVINKESIAESRRGFGQLPFTLPSPTDRADKLSQYQNKLLVHYNTSSLAYYDNNTGLHTYSGSYSHPDPALAKIRTAEANSNLYFTTSKGIQKLDSVTGTPGQAGMYKALDCSATLSTNPSGFFATNNQVAYRVLWGIKDANENLILGSPSQRSVIANASGSSSDVSLQVTIPSGVTTSHFYQIYRSNQSGSSTTVPDDNMQLVYEANPTSGQISAKSLTVIDSTPDSLRGAALYTNSSQEGILQSNELPPYANDICAFKDCLFFGNIKTKQQIQFTLLSVGGTNGVQLGDTLTIAGTTYTAAASENVGSLQYKLVTSGSPAQNINDTALSLIRVINQNATNTSVYAYYLSSTTSLPGLILIEERILGGSPYSMTASAHGSAFSPTLPTSGASVQSSNQAALNGLMYSKQQVPEAVPSTNILYVGSASQKILRIIPLRDSLFILKDDSIYRCTGTAPGNFTIDLLDSTAALLAPESAVALNNNIFALTTQGVVAITDTGVSVVSRNIENSLTTLFGSSLVALSAYSFGVSYESERQYVLWTVTSSSDTYATQAFVYNIFTRAWTRWTRQQSHGIVLKSDNRMYASDPLSSSINQERKNLDYHDYVDEQYLISPVSVTGPSFVVSDLTNIEVGDLIYQSDSVASIVLAIDVLSKTLTLSESVTGWNFSNPTYVQKAIPCLIEWLPNTAQNPGLLKHWSDAAILFRQNIFTNANLSFYSEISGSLESVPFQGQTGGAWGRFAWGTGALWGGVTRTTPFRTYIPRDKQRCDLLTVQFSCRNAWARFQIEGLSLVLAAVSTRMAR